MPKIKKIVSGGQTGVDRATLDVAIEMGIPHGGCCPKGRRAEDGPIDSLYQLKETPREDYIQRTEWNVRDSDGTLILCFGAPTGGTAFTVECARRTKKPILIIDMKSDPPDKNIFVNWIDKNRIQILNVAGPRESTAPTVYPRARQVLSEIIRNPSVTKGRGFGFFMGSFG